MVIYADSFAFLPYALLISFDVSSNVMVNLERRAAKCVIWKYRHY